MAMYRCMPLVCSIDTLSFTARRAALERAAIVQQVRPERCFIDINRCTGRRLPLSWLYGCAAGATLQRAEASPGPPGEVDFGTQDICLTRLCSFRCERTMSCTLRPLHLQRLAASPYCIPAGLDSSPEPALRTRRDASRKTFAQFVEASL